MNNNTKKYGMGGAVQSFSSPMLAQGMQGGLSGFGTSGLQTFADGGQMTDIERILAKYKAMESNKPKEDETSEFLRKSWEGKNIDDYVMYSDKYKRGGKMAQGGLIEHGLQEGDSIVKEVENKWLIVKSKSGVFSVVDIEKGSRFIVGLDDSKTSGKRTSAKAGVKQAMDYINYLKSTKMAKGGTFANGGGLDDAKIYVADLAEYNNGRLVGKWLDLSDYSSGAEVMEAIQEMLDEQTKKDKYGDVHEEYAIHDYEGFPSSFYHESMGESDFDQLYEILKIADDANLPLDVLMKAMSDLGYEDDPQRVAEEYSSSIPASMGNEWRDFAYEWADSVGIDGVGNIESYFDYEEFGNDIRMDYSQEELEEMGYDDLSDEELGERNVEEIGGVENLPKNTLEMYFDYAKLGRDLEYDYTAIRGKDGDFYFFNRNFAKGGKLKYAKGGKTKAKKSKNDAYIVYIYANSKVGEDPTFANVEPISFPTLSKATEFVRLIIAENISEIDKVEVFSKSGQRVQVWNNSESDKNIKEKYLYKQKIPNNYQGKSAEKVWSLLTPAQRSHYLEDHENGEYKNLIHSDWDELNDRVRNGFEMHVQEGQYAKGGKTSTQKIYEVEYEIGGKKHTSQFLMYDSDRVENLLPPATKIISIKEKFAKGGEVGKKFILSFQYNPSNLSNQNAEKIVEKYTKDWSRNNDFDEVSFYVMGLTKSKADELKRELEMEDAYGIEIENSRYAKGGKIGFEGLAKKVAKRYVGKKVSKEYQAEYGKTYDAKEAKEVGNKVAGKVYQQQVAKKKIVRKLQRKSK
jgi:antirestriction protein